MKKSAAILLLVLTISTLHAQEASNSVGFWQNDELGLPVYNYTGALPFIAKTPKGKTVKLPNDPLFLLGNYRMTLFTHVSGIYQLMTGERAWGRLNQGTKNYGENGAEVSIQSSKWKGKQQISLVGINDNAAVRVEKTFGTGYAKYNYNLQNGLNCKRIISVKPSTEINKGETAFVLAVKFKNSSKADMSITYREFVTAHYEMAQEQAKTENRKLVSYKNQILTDNSRDIIKCDFGIVSKDPTISSDKNEANKYDVSPPSLFFKIQKKQNSKIAYKLYSEKSEKQKDKLYVEATFVLKAGESTELQFVEGFSFEKEFSDIEALCQKMQTVEKPTAKGNQYQSEALFREQWKKKLPDFKQEQNKTLASEMIWDAYTLEAMATYSAYFNETYIPQGTVYDYEFGTPAAVRDHLQHMLPLCYYNPQLAKSCLRFCLKKMTLSGELRYTDYGYGMTSNLCFNTSDQQLYLFQSIAEYIRITGDVNFLLEETSYQPLESGLKGSTIDKIQRAYIYYRDEVSLGPKGLPRILNSDWNDAFFFLKSSTIYYGTAESHMNAVMTIKIFADLLKTLEPLSASAAFQGQQQKIKHLSVALSDYREKIKTAYLSDFGNRNFSMRCYLTDKLPQGDADMYLEPQSYLLQLPEISVDRKIGIYKEVKKRILDNELLGARQMETPLTVFPIPAGSRENGGFWFSLQGPLILGVATFDKAEAKRLFEKMTFDNFSKKYPNYWAGQWSQTDALYSSLCDEEGLADESFCADFPVFCAHPHAWPLYCYFKLSER